MAFSPLISGGYSVMRGPAPAQEGVKGRRRPRPRWVGLACRRGLSLLTTPPCGDRGAKAGHRKSLTRGGIRSKVTAVGSGNRTNHGASARRKSADSPAEGDSSVSGPAGKTDSGESVSDSGPEGKSFFNALNAFAVRFRIPDYAARQSIQGRYAATERAALVVRVGCQDFFAGRHWHIQPVLVKLRRSCDSGSGVGFHRCLPDQLAIRGIQRVGIALQVAEVCQVFPWRFPRADTYCRAQPSSCF
jgi:hypothetical protein